MINTEKVIGFYIDVFGNEIDEYEQITKYSVSYKGALFFGDNFGWNTVGVDSWEKAKAIYDILDGRDVYITDNAYDCTFINGEWN